jgi:hypothetical protein
VGDLTLWMQLDFLTAVGTPKLRAAETHPSEP